MGYVNSRIMCIKFKFTRFKLCIVEMHGPTERDDEEWKRFWSEFGIFRDRVCILHRLCAMRGLNGEIRDSVKEGIIGALIVTWNYMEGN